MVQPTELTSKCLHNLKQVISTQAYKDIVLSSIRSKKSWSAKCCWGSEGWSPCLRFSPANPVQNCVPCKRKGSYKEQLIKFRLSDTVARTIEKLQLGRINFWTSFYVLTYAINFKLQYSGIEECQNCWGRGKASQCLFIQQSLLKAVASRAGCSSLCPAGFPRAENLYATCSTICSPSEEAAFS